MVIRTLFSFALRRNHLDVTTKYGYGRTIQRSVCLTLTCLNIIAAMPEKSVTEGFIWIIALHSRYSVLFRRVRGEALHLSHKCRFR